MLLRNALLADGSLADIRISGATIAAVAATLTPQPDETVEDLGGALVVTSMAEPHAHLDKAFLAERFDNPTGDLLGAINAMIANRHLITRDDTIARAERAVQVLVSNGVTAIRTHADVTADNGLTSAEALVEVRRRVADFCDVQVVALCGWPIAGPHGASQRALLRDALALGVDLVGGCPHLCEDPIEANETFLALAAEAGVGVDLHTDETLDPSALSVEDLAERVLASGFAHPVTASHCVSLGVQPPDVQQRVADKIAAAGINVVTLPQTNLYLQGRDHPSGSPRGLTAVAALRSAGVTVAAGADNLQDPFNLVGKGDPLETAALMVMAGHLLPGAAYETVSQEAHRVISSTDRRVAPGSQADLVVIPARSVRESIAFQPSCRRIMRQGRWLRQPTVPIGKNGETRS